MAYPPPYAPQRSMNGIAIASLVSGIVSWVALPLVAAVPAVVMGHLALKQIRRTGEEGGALATTGLVLGYLNLAVSILVACAFGAVVLGCYAFVLNLDPVTTTPTPSPEPFPTG